MRYMDEIKKSNSIKELKKETYDDLTYDAHSLTYSNG